MDMYRFDWLSKRSEVAIDEHRPIIDPHHHLWRNAGGTYLANELLADTGGTHNVTHTVFVECRSKWDKEASDAQAPVGETRFVAGEAAEMSERNGAQLGGIVSFADLTLGNAVADVLEAHVEAGAGLFRGIRHATSWHSDDVPHNAHTGSSEQMMRSDRFIEGARVLAAMGLGFDAWLYHTQLVELVELADAVPDLSIVIDHLGAPLGVGRYTDRSAVRNAWRDSMAAAAQRENINLKLGGVGMDNVFGTGWSDLQRPPSSEQVADYWADDIRWAIDTFGPGRCMFESNFPVDRATVPYGVLWNAFQIIADGYSEAEQDLLFSGTAAQVYRIDLI